jgi:phosphoadenosine phosphosulfate reductase
MPVTTSLETIEGLDVESLVVSILAESEASKVCLTCSFQAEDMIVLDLLRRRLPRLPVLFLETGYHFAETYQFRDRMTAEWGLNLVNALPRKTVQQQESELGILYREDPAKCCQLRKVEPLMASLEPFDIWFTGLRREQSPTRKNLKKMDLGAGLGIHGQTQTKLSPAVRPGLREHRLRALHGNSR